MLYNRDEVYQATLRYFRGDTLAANTFFKYCLKDKEGQFHEQTPDDMHRRLAKEFARIEKKYEHPMDEEYIYSFLRDFRYIVPQGSPMMGIGNNFVNLSLSNCVVVASPQDSISSIMDTGKDLANLFKRRCGVGLDISDLRPDGQAVSNAAGTTSGAWSFADFYSFVCRMIGQNGRRGALMIAMDIRHPDILKFINMKRDLTKVTGANISVKLTDDFMQAVVEDKDYIQFWPLTPNQSGKISRSVNAREVWEEIVKAATETAEPGLLFWDNATKSLPAHEYEDFRTVCVNPCAELMLSAYDSCRLISINLKHLVSDPFTKNAHFDAAKFQEVAAVAQRLSDDLVDLELEKIDRMIGSVDEEDEKVLWGKLRDACVNGRRTGLGTHGLADALACLNLRYDSDEGLEMIDFIYRTLKETAYMTSAKLAKERGSFPVFNWEKEKDNLFIRSLPNKIIEEMMKYGRRNISILTNAPTGSVSILSQTSSGIEPVFRNSYTRRKKKNHDEKPADTDYIDTVGDRWVEYPVYHHNVKEYMDLHILEKDKEGNSLPLPDFFVTSEEINWERRVEIQSVIQSHIDHSISSTINLPRGTSPEVVGKLYQLAWQKGLKGVTVYVDGSRDGVLITEPTAKKEEFQYIDAPSRGESLECDIHNVSVKGEGWVILVGLKDGKPYEVFGGLSENIEIPPNYKKGTLTKINEKKRKPSRYDLELNGLKIKDVIKIFDNPTYQVHTRMVSLALRHGAKPSFLVEQLQKDPDNDLTSFSKVLSRVLKKYVADGTKVSGSSTCQDCGGELIYQDGCVMCNDCGWSKCG